MSKKDWIVIFSIIIIGGVLAWFINLSLSYGSLIKTKLPLNDWLNFWGGYCGGLFAAIVGYLAIVYSNRNSEKAINQQYKLLLEQDKRKEFEEYVNCLKSNLNVINLVEFNKFLGSIDSENYLFSISSSLDKKISVYSQDIEFNYIISLKDNEKTDMENQYSEYWNQAKNYYIELLDVYESLIRRIKRNKIEEKLKLNMKQLLSQAQYNLSQNPNYSFQYNNEILSYQNEITELTKNIDSYKKDIDDYTNSIKNLIDELTPLLKTLFELSISLIKEKQTLLNCQSQ